MTDIVCVCVEGVLISQYCTIQQISIYTISPLLYVQQQIVCGTKICDHHVCMSVCMQAIELRWPVIADQDF